MPPSPVSSVNNRELWTHILRRSATKVTYVLQDLIKEAILTLKERGGSSPAAIKKVIGQKHPSLPAGWEKVTALQLKRLTAAGKLVKVPPYFTALMS